MERRQSNRRSPPPVDDAPLPWMNRVPPFMVILYALAFVFSWMVLAVWWWLR